MSTKPNTSQITYDTGSNKQDLNNILDTVVPISDYAALRNYTGRATQVRITADGISEFFKYDSTDTTSTDNGGTIIVAGTKRWKRVFDGAVSVKWFGAVGDGVTDDTIAVQKAIDYCLSFATPKALYVDSMCLITSSLYINRLVDTTESELFIISNGSGGFYVNSAITIFDSTLPMPGVDPQSEFVTFSGVRLAAGPAGVSAYTLSKKFLRMKFNNCYWHKLRLVASDSYLQSFYFSMCNIRHWPGAWCSASHAFDTHFDQCISEFGDGQFTFFPNGSYSLTFRDGVHEGSGGPLVSGGGFRQLVVDGMYLEQNSTENIQLSYGPQNTNVTITNNMMLSNPANTANPAFYDIDWGNTLKPVSGGNQHFNGRLHGNGSLPSGSSIVGANSDYAALSVVQLANRVDAIYFTHTLACTLGGGTSNNAAFVKVAGDVTFEFSFTFPVSSSGSPAVLYDLPLPAANGLISGEVVFTDYTVAPIRVIGGSGFSATASASRIALSSGQGDSWLTYADVSGKTVVGKIIYRHSGF